MTSYGASRSGREPGSTATVHPPVDELSHLATKLNAGEQAVLDRLVDLLDDRWHIFVQPHVLNLHPDLLICAPHHGVTVIEVKHWTPGAYRNNGGVLEVRDANGDWWPSKEDPLRQVHRYRQLLEESVVSPPGHNEFRNVRGCVILPSFDEATLEPLLGESSELPSSSRARIALVGREAMEDRDTAKRLIYGASRVGRGLDQATFDRLLDRLAEPEAIGDQRRALSMSSGAQNVARNPNEARTRRVRGPAGSGKTLGLAARAANLAGEGKRVLFLTFNITLAHYAQDLVRRHARAEETDHRLVDCIHFHGFCNSVVQRAGGATRLAIAEGLEPDEIPVERAKAAYRDWPDLVPQYDAVLVDEGQDFTEDWWQFLRSDVCKAGGELLLAADTAQDIYGRSDWTSESRMARCGFSGPWTELEGSYRLPPDLIPVLHEFASTFLPGAELQLPTEPPDRPGVAAAPTIRRWVNVQQAEREPSRLAKAVADAVMSMLEEPSPPKPADVVVLSSNHHTGERVMGELVHRDVHVESLFATDETERRKRKIRFWPGVNALKGSTVHSFKGWEARGVVVVMEDGFESDGSDAGLAYVALSRVKGDPNNRSAFVTVVNASNQFTPFKDRFERPIGPDEVPALAGQLELAADQYPEPSG